MGPISRRELTTCTSPIASGRRKEIHSRVAEHPHWKSSNPLCQRCGRHETVLSGVAVEKLIRKLSVTNLKPQYFMHKPWTALSIVHFTHLLTTDDSHTCGCWDFMYEDDQYQKTWNLLNSLVFFSSEEFLILCTCLQDFIVCRKFYKYNNRGHLTVTGRIVVCIFATAHLIVSFS